MKKKGIGSKIVIHIVLILGALTMVFPFIWMVLTSFKTFDETTAIPPTIFPKVWEVSNYQTVLTNLPFGEFYVNTFTMMLFRILFAVVFSSMAGYIFAKAEFPGKKVLFMIVLLQMMVPGQIYILPQYLMVSKLGWLNTVRALIFPAVVSAFGTFLMRQCYMNIPNDLEEASVLDGCNRWRTFWHIMFPLSKSNVAALSIFTALFSWKDMLWPLIVNMSIDKMPLASGIATLQSQYYTNYAQLMAGGVIAIIPMAILFIIFQKQFVEGIATTGSKN